MSQTSYLESVVTWNENQCRENLKDALPKLTNQLAETSVSEEELGICKIICQLFLPWVKIQDVERTVFIHVTAKMCCIMDKVLTGINELCQQTAVQTDIQALLEVLVEVLDCYSSCFKYVQSKGDNPFSITQVHSLPYGAVHLLKGAYTHCKESGTIYGDYLPSVTDLLSALFKKAHGLQMSLLGMLEKITVDNEVTEDVVQDLCFICQGLFEVCQTVTSLDAKLVCSLWKTISRFAGRHSNQLKNDLDLDQMVTFLCEEIKTGYVYLFQLAPPRVDSMEMSLSQGDAAAFQKSLKVLSYQLRIMISLLDNFIDYVSQCEQNILQLVICIYRNLPPCLDAPCVSETHIEEIQRQILNGTEPLITLLVRKYNFIECVTATEKDLLSPGDHFPFLIILLKILDCIHKQTDDVINKWMCPKLYEGDVQRDGVLECMFKTLHKCYVEMSLTEPSEIYMLTDKARSVSLYEYVCIHVCGFVGSIRSRHFHVLEQCLMKNLLSNNMYVSSLVMDVWCFMARFGSADLCFKQARLLLDLCSRPELQCLDYCHNLSTLTRRLIKFLAPEHQLQIVKQYPPEQYLWLYKLLPVSVYEERQRAELTNTLIQKLVTTSQMLVNSTDVTFGQVESLIEILQCINNCIAADYNEAQLSHQLPEQLSNCIYQLWSVWDKDWLGTPLLDICLSEMIELTGCCMQRLPDGIFIKKDVCVFEVTGITGCCMQSLPNNILIKIFDLLTYIVMDSRSQQGTKWTVTQFLSNCRKFRFPPNAQQPQILKRIPQMFQKLLNDPDVLIHHGALEAFSQFAENTPHEEIVPECLGTSNLLQDVVVSFLNKKPYIESSIDQTEYLKSQSAILSDKLSSIETCSNQTKTVNTDLNSKSVEEGAGKDNCDQKTIKGVNSDGELNKGGNSDKDVNKGDNPDRDMLDDITCPDEPSLKRKRLTQDTQCGADDIIDKLEKNINDLDLYPRSSLTQDNVNKLRLLHTRLKSVIDSVQ